MNSEIKVVEEDSPILEVLLDGGEIVQPSTDVIDGVTVTSFAQSSPLTSDTVTLIRQNSLFLSRMVLHKQKREDLDVLSLHLLNPH